jgi:hypothetical protein
MRISLVLALGLMAGALGACGKANEAEKLGAGEAAGAGCSSSKLPTTGVCSDANPALFAAIDPKIETVAQGCVWRTEELQTEPDEALVFRAQDCTGEQWDKTVYSWVGNYVKARLASVPEDQAIFLLEVHDVPEGETAENVALKTLAAAPEDQRERCIATPLPEIKAAGHAFELGPNAELEAELMASHPDERWEACGPNGVTVDAIQYWEGRERRALFHIVGQDEPLWDPASFTFYVREADGSWRKSG